MVPPLNSNVGPSDDAERGSSSPPTQLKLDEAAPRMNASPTISGVYPSRIGVEGGTEVTVIGTQFAHSARARCRLGPADWGPQCGFVVEGREGSPSNPRYGFQWPTTSFEKPSATNYTSVATVINSTALRCAVPSVPLAGAATLSVTMDDGATFSTPSRGSCVLMVPTISAAPSRRPFFGEMSGAIVLSSDRTLAGMQNLSVSAELETPAVTLLDHVAIAGGVSTRLPFDLTPLPKRVSTRLRVTLHLPDGDVWVSRFFERVPPTTLHNGSTSVDYEHSAVLVNGQRWILTGMYMGQPQLVGGPPAWSGSAGAAGLMSIEQLAKSGLNTVMVYGLGWNISSAGDGWTPEHRTLFMDNMAAIGVKVLLHVCYLTSPLLLPGGNTSEHWLPFKAMVEEMKGHESLLGYYICTIVMASRFVALVSLT